MTYVNDLTNVLSEHLPWHRARLKFIARFTSALLRLTPANLRKLALALKGSVGPASNYRRIQRFLSGYAMDFEALGRLLVCLLPQQPPYVVIVDRTEWHLGQTPVNVLTVGIAHRGICFPVAFAALRAGGGSSADEQTEVLERFLRVVEPAQVEAVVADREFIGANWLSHLKARKIPFVVRLRSDRRVGLPSQDSLREGPAMPVRMFARSCEIGKTRLLEGTRWIYGVEGPAVSVRVVVGRLAAGTGGSRSGRFPILAASGVDASAQPESEFGSALTEQVLRLYRRRWEIETLFAALKSRGFKLEKTRLTCPERVERLMELLAVAFSWSHLIGEKREQIHGGPRELAHGRPARSPLPLRTRPAAGDSAGLRGAAECLPGVSQCASSSVLVFVMYIGWLYRVEKVCHASYHGRTRY